MTQTLTTDELRQIVETDHTQCGDAAAMARELLANREAQPVAEVVSKYGDPEAFGEREIRVLADLQQIPYDTKLFTAPPAPAVPDKPRLPPHVYRDLLDMLQEAAIAYGGTQQLRAQLSSALSIHVQPDHPHTRAAMLAQPVSQHCEWTYDEHDSKWDSSCGDAWMFCDGGPTENGVKFCQNCGKPVLLAAAPEGGN